MNFYYFIKNLFKDVVILIMDLILIYKMKILIIFCSIQVFLFKIDYFYNNKPNLDFV